jgi:DNA-directed RNA polymerase specialized sigma24 family protein
MNSDTKPGSIDIGDLSKLPPAERVQAAEDAVARLRAEMSRLWEIRRDAIRELRAHGMSAAEIGEELGITRQNIHRMLRTEGGPVQP